MFSTNNEKYKAYDILYRYLAIMANTHIINGSIMYKLKTLTKQIIIFTVHRKINKTHWDWKKVTQ